MSAHASVLLHDLLGHNRGYSLCGAGPSFLTLRVLALSKRLLFVARGCGIVDRSTTGFNSDGVGGRSVDGRPVGGLAQTPWTNSNTLPR
jgi:hypothetical protein